MSTQHPQVTIPDTEMRTLASSLTGYEYKIFVSLPAGYADTNKMYPTLYGLDPHLTFGMSTEITRLLAFGEELPQLIIIGIGFSEDKDMESYQVRNYVPTGSLEEAGSGGAEDLRATVFIGAGSLEPEFVVNNILKLEKAFQNRNYPNLRLHTHIFEGETHLSVVPNIISRGLKVVYE